MNTVLYINENTLFSTMVQLLNMEEYKLQKENIQL